MTQPDFTPALLPSGGVMQAGIGKSSGGGIAHSNFLIRGVVTATYVADDPNHPFYEDGAYAIYCDVLCYTTMNGGRIYPLYAVLVTQESSSAQEGRVWRPRATTQDLSGVPLDKASRMDYMSWDGDHVLIGFMDDDRTLPVILRSLPHPKADIGIASTQPAGQRTRLTLVDGRPNLTKHAGSVYGITKDGDVLIDASRGTGRDTLPGGAQAPPLSGSIKQRAHAAGTITRELVLPTGPVETPVVKETLSAASWSLTFLTTPGGLAITGPTGPVFAFVPPTPGVPAALKLGSGGSSVADAGKVADAINALVSIFNAHFHTYPATSATPTSPPTLLQLKIGADALGNRNMDLPNST